MFVHSSWVGNTYSLRTMCGRGDTDIRASRLASRSVVAIEIRDELLHPGEIPRKDWPDVAALERRPALTARVPYDPSERRAVEAHLARDRVHEREVIGRNRLAVQAQECAKD